MCYSSPTHTNEVVKSRAMKNFLRALRFAYSYRSRVLFSVICAILAAGFWSINFTAIYPVLKILGSDQNLQQWVHESIERIQTLQVVPLQAKIDHFEELSRDLAGGPNNAYTEQRKRDLARDTAKVVSRLELARYELYRYRMAKKYIDLLLPSDRFQTLVVVVVLVIIGVAFKGFFEFCQETLVGNVVNRSLFDLRNLFYRKAIHDDLSHFNEQGTHELMARFTNDMEILGSGTKTLFGRLVAEPLRALGCVIVACWISWRLTLMFLIVVPIALLILTNVARVMKQATRRLLERMSQVYKILQETFQGIRIVKAFAAEGKERLRFRQATDEYYQKAMWVVTLESLSGPIIEVLGVAAVAGALLVGAYLVLNQETRIPLFGIRLTDTPMEAETLLQLYVLLAAIADPVRKMSNVFTKIQSGAAAADRIFAFVDRKPKIGANSRRMRLERHEDAIEFRNVCFSYEPGNPILANVDLTVHFGETVALVGKNGCGKTTLMNLLPRFYDPDHGSILIDGQDIRAANLRSLRQQVGIVTQDTILFDDSVRNNIAYGRRKAKPEAIEEAARQAFAHDFILSLPNGYETRIGEGGAKLSGGQKQRICLARAILNDPSILVLDEFTSQSDSESEALIHKVLREFMRSRTSFVITHRLNTLEIADRIIVLEKGRIIAVGTHNELLDNCDLYQRLHEAHFQRMVA